jgi:hypothetical protein
MSDSCLWFRAANVAAAFPTTMAAHPKGGTQCLGP